MQQQPGESRTQPSPRRKERVWLTIRSLDTRFQSSRLTEFGGRGMSFNICRGTPGSLAMFTAIRNPRQAVAASSTTAAAAHPQNRGRQLSDRHAVQAQLIENVLGQFIGELIQEEQHGRCIQGGRFGGAVIQCLDQGPLSIVKPDTSRRIYQCHGFIKQIKPALGERAVLSLRCKCASAIGRLGH
jgi:hypothetical protein